LERGGSSAVGRGRAGQQHCYHHTPTIKPEAATAVVEVLVMGVVAIRPDHDQQHCYHHTPTVKLDAATTVVELLMMGVRMPETR
jgi:hypothetical protein